MKPVLLAVAFAVCVGLVGCGDSAPAQPGGSNAPPAQDSGAGAKQKTGAGRIPAPK